jgi:hypothetical protein
MQVNPGIFAELRFGSEAGLFRRLSPLALRVGGTQVHQLIA